MSKIKHRVKLEIEKSDKNNYFLARSIVYQRPNGGGPEYESNIVKIHVGRDGAIFFSSDDSDDFIYFYLEQIPHLKKALARLKRLMAKEPKCPAAWLARRRKREVIK